MMLNCKKKLQEPAFKEYVQIAGFSVEECAKNVCGSLNFKYSFAQAMKLNHVGEFNLVANSDRIFKAIGKKAGVKLKEQERTPIAEPRIPNVAPAA